MKKIMTISLLLDMYVLSVSAQCEKPENVSYNEYGGKAE